MTRGAAWSIPVVSLAVAAPAMAASGCKMTTGLLNWDVFADGSNQTGKALATTGGTGVTVTVSTDRRRPVRPTTASVDRAPRPAVCPR